MVTIRGAGDDLRWSFAAVRTGRRPSRVAGEPRGPPARRAAIVLFA